MAVEEETVDEIETETESVTETAVEEQPAEAPASPNGVRLGNQFEIQPNLPMADLASPFAEAYAVTQTGNPTRRLFALICDFKMPLREHALYAVKNFTGQPIMRPLMWQPVFWPPSGREVTAIIMEAPNGHRVMAAAGGEAIPGSKLVQWVEPICSLLGELQEARTTHRAIRPDNLFFLEEEGQITLGECFSTPAGYANPAIVETVERAQAVPGGRGEGTISEDFYAFGATLAILALGHNPVAGLDIFELAERRLENGSYATLVGAAQLPGDVTDLIRGLMQDDPRERWGTKEVQQWLSGRGSVTQTQSSRPRAERGITFAENEYRTSRTLANALNRDWSEAIVAVKQPDLQQWATRSLKDLRCAIALEDARQNSDNKGQPLTDDAIVARSIIALDPTGPLRFRGFAVMPDGLGPVLASHQGNSEDMRSFTEIVGNLLPVFWMQQQRQAPSNLGSLTEQCVRLARHLAQNLPGFHVERCLYELNPTMPCQSPHTAPHYCVDTSQALRALEANAEKMDTSIDRHLASFLAARLHANIDRFLNRIAAAQAPDQLMLAQMQVLSVVQSKAGPASLPRLCKALLGKMDPIFDGFRNRQLRQRLRTAAKQTAERGRLQDLLAIVESKRSKIWDDREFQLAQRSFRAAEAEVANLSNSGKARRRRAAALGKQTAAFASGMLAVATITIIFLVQMN